MSQRQPGRSAKASTRRDVIVAAICGASVAGMVGMAYAAVPLYNWFCRTTGFGGTPQQASAAPGAVLDRTINVRFDSNIARGLPWRFVPEQNQITVKLGQVVTVKYKVTNQAARATFAQASYNVSPPQAGAYFQKINCFCFTEQRMGPGETREMSVVFYVDPKLAQDPEQIRRGGITLSYTFYPLPEPEKPVSQLNQPGRTGQL